MTDTIYGHKIKPEHLARKAIVCLRQSSDRQVAYHKEGVRYSSYRDDRTDARPGLRARLRSSIAIWGIERGDCFCPARRLRACYRARLHWER